MAGGPRDAGCVGCPAGGWFVSPTETGVSYRTYLGIGGEIHRIHVWYISLHLP